MTDAVSAARAKIASLKAEIARLEDFLSLYDELSQEGKRIRVEPAKEAGDISHASSRLNETPQNASVDKSGTRHHRQRGDMRPADVAELMERVIREAGRPMTRGEIVEAFERRDVRIPFEDKARYIGTIAWRHKGMFRNIEGRGYWLSDTLLPSRGQASLIGIDDEIPI